MRSSLIDFLAGALSVTYVFAAVFFLRFWRRTRDGLFSTFSVAFTLLAANQFLVFWLGAEDERTGFTYVLRVLGFLVILYGIVRKNVPNRT